VDHTDKATHFLLALSNARNFSKLVIEKCPSSNAAIGMITKSWFIRKLVQKMKTLVIHVRMSHSFESLTDQQLEMMSEVYAHLSALISFNTSATADDQKYQLYWKTSDVQRFLRLELPQVYEHSVRNFVTDFVVENVNEGHLGRSILIL
jgi:hypothetical protein